MTAANAVGHPHLKEKTCRIREHTDLGMANEPITVRSIDRCARKEALSQGAAQ